MYSIMVTIGLFMTLFFQMMILLWCYSQFIPLRLGKSAYVIYPAWGGIGCFVISTVLDVGIWEGNFAKSLCDFVILFAGVLLISRGSKSKKLAAFGISIFFITLADIVSMAILVNTMPNIYRKFMAGEDEAKLIINIQMLLIYFLIVGGVAFFTKKRNKEYTFEDYKFFIFFPLSQFLCLLVFYVLMSMYNFKLALILSICGVFLFLIVDYGAFQAIEKIKEKKVLEERAIFFEQQLKSQVTYYEDFQEYNQELKKLRHDMKNQMQTIQTLIKQENYKAANQCAENVLLETEKMNNFSFCEHEMLNALFFNMFKLISRKEEKIDFKYAIYLPKDINIEGLDLCRLFSNIMDNAIEGCRYATGDKFIHMIANIVKGNLTIKCENSCSEILKTDERTGTFITMKEGKGHGNGIPIMREIVEKYQGAIGFSHEQDKFVLTAYLCLKV